MVNFILKFDNSRHLLEFKMEDMLNRKNIVGAGEWTSELENWLEKSLRIQLNEISSKNLTSVLEGGTGSERDARFETQFVENCRETLLLRFRKYKESQVN